jgi:hypothetical protein
MNRQLDRMVDVPSGLTSVRVLEGRKKKRQKKSGALAPLENCVDPIIPDI